MAKSKRRPTLRAQVDRLERQNMHLKAQARGWKSVAEDAPNDFVKLTRLFEQYQKLQQENQALKRTRASLELATRDPTMPLQ